MATPADGALTPITAIALVGVLGVGSQWLAWRLRMPAIVLMLLAGVIVGPVLGVFDPARDIGTLYRPMISLAVAVILFEGGLTLNFHSLRDAASGVRRLVLVGAPLGWVMSVLALRYGAGLGWEASWVFGGIMIVTGPTVIAPLLRQARLSRRPAALLQWEAIVNDPIGALAAVLAFEVVVVLRTAEGVGDAALSLVVGIVVAGAVGYVAGRGVALTFSRAIVPEYMKVPVLFAVLLAVFAGTDTILHESGLLAVTVMGLVIANADLPSYTELRRFKEHATVLLVSGVFILLAASLDFAALARLDWRAGVFVAAVVLLARPITVLVSLLGTAIPWRERALVALTGPRGVVLVAVAGLFGERLAEIGVEDGTIIGPLAFVLVAATVVLHGFSLRPLAARLGLTGAEVPGVLIVGASVWAVAFGETLKKLGVPILVADTNLTRLRAPRAAGLPVFYGDILSEAAEHGVELVSFETVIAASNNDAYNTLVATDLAPEFGRDAVYQFAREKSDSKRHALPATLGGRALADGVELAVMNARLADGWTMHITDMTKAYTLEQFRAERAGSVILAVLEGKELRLARPDAPAKAGNGARVVSLRPPESEAAPRGPVRTDTAAPTDGDGSSDPAAAPDAPGSG